MLINALVLFVHRCGMNMHGNLHMLEGNLGQKFFEKSSMKNINL